MDADTCKGSCSLVRHTLSLQKHVQKVFQKQESMEEMFHRRQASLKKLAARQTRPVQPVAPRPEALTKSPCPSPGMFRRASLLQGTPSLLSTVSPSPKAITCFMNQVLSTLSP